MKTSIIKCLSIVFAIVLLSDCKKKESSPAEEETDPYTYSSDLQITRDAQFATRHIIDVGMVCAHLGEGQFFANAYVECAGQPTSTAIRDTVTKQMLMSWNTTPCRDGLTRSGTVFFYYGFDPSTNPGANPNARYYRNMGYVARVQFSQYVVDGWKIELFDPNVPAFISNQISAGFNPASNKLTWKIAGKFKLIHPTDPGKNIVWDGSISQVLENTNSAQVYNPNGQNAINWNKSQVSYSGLISGSTGSTSFNYQLSSTEPILRDFNCSFALTAKTGADLYHPFVKGKAECKFGNFHPRTVDFGASACDNTATISFKDESHTVTFD
jgi:hypothetical protein